eukprot:TRINITY_DN1025_c0_g1_i1.p1 TRINITY_DN1025_c0_g1~~TRINITY_DN1025_c0_g1_i1.p1  ORF type:complete len:325 (+),score=63.04 TRINITY_DN1025_c0_g1_i1:97-1071(+)
MASLRFTDAPGAAGGEAGHALDLRDPKLKLYLEQFGGVADVLSLCDSQSHPGSSCSHSLRSDPFDTSLGRSTRSQLSVSGAAGPALRKSVSFASALWTAPDTEGGIVHDAATLPFQPPLTEVVDRAMDVLHKAFRGMHKTPTVFGPMWPTSIDMSVLTDAPQRVEQNSYIGDGLWLGSLGSLAKHGVPPNCHVLTLLDNASLPMPDVCMRAVAHAKCHTIVRVADGPLGSLRMHLRVYVTMIQTARASGCSVFTHCVAGLNRSAQVCVAWLMLCYGMPLAAAVATVERARGTQILSNRALQAELLLFDEFLADERRASQKPSSL